MFTPFRAALGCAAVTAALLVASAVAGGPAAEPTAKEAQPIIDKALAFFKTQQAADGYRGGDQPETERAHA